MSIDDGQTWEAVHAVEDSLYISGGRVAGRSVSVGGREVLWGGGGGACCFHRAYFVEHRSMLRVVYVSLMR